jgi:hypothetical protein
MRPFVCLGEPHVVDAARESVVVQKVPAIQNLRYIS